MPTRRQVAKTRRAISPRLATRRRRITGLPFRTSGPEHATSGPEHADVLGALDRGTVHRGQAEPEDRTGVAGVDDAVVRQLSAGGGAVGRPVGRPAEQETRLVRTPVDAAGLF